MLHYGNYGFDQSIFSIYGFIDHITGWCHTFNHSISKVCFQMPPHPPFNLQNPSWRKPDVFAAAWLAPLPVAQNTDFICLINFSIRVHSLNPLTPVSSLGFFQPCEGYSPSLHGNTITQRGGLHIRSARRVNILETADSLEARRAKQIDYTLQHTIPAGLASAHVSIGETSVFLSLCTSSFISTY